LKIVVRLAAAGIAALALTAQGAVLTPAHNPFPSPAQVITKADSPTPEPATLGLIGAGLTTLALLLRRRHTRKR
jgi:hypothetical protein